MGRLSIRSKLQDDLLCRNMYRVHYINNKLQFLLKRFRKTLITVEVVLYIVRHY